jgi:hypothetical protein
VPCTEVTLPQPPPLKPPPKRLRMPQVPPMGPCSLTKDRLLFIFSECLKTPQLLAVLLHWCPMK